ncbi:hypothetical protein P8452_02949 [Trifolium repens]|nr:hypothetical protein P8452_02949 [Trifolium repens]
MQIIPTPSEASPPPGDNTPKPPEKRRTKSLPGPKQPLPPRRSRTDLEAERFKAAHQPSSSAAVAQSDKPVAFLSTSSLGPWVLDSGAFDHMTGSTYKTDRLEQGVSLEDYIIYHRRWHVF